MKPILYRKYPKAGQCHVIGCKHGTTKKTKLCDACRSKKSRLADPVRYAFQNLKNRAGQRGKEFTITLDEFRAWCIRENFTPGTGRASDSWSIDRDKNELGYTIDNIKKMRKGANTSKYFKNDYPKALANIASEEVVTDLPF